MKEREREREGEIHTFCKEPKIYHCLQNLNLLSSSWNSLIHLNSLFQRSSLKSFICVVTLKGILIQLDAEMLLRMVLCLLRRPYTKCAVGRGGGEDVTFNSF